MDWEHNGGPAPARRRTTHLQSKKPKKREKIAANKKREENRRPGKNDCRDGEKRPEKWGKSLEGKSNGFPKREENRRDKKKKNSKLEGKTQGSGGVLTLKNNNGGEKI